MATHGYRWQNTISFNSHYPSFKIFVGLTFALLDYDIFSIKN